MRKGQHIFFIETKNVVSQSGQYRAITV